MRRARRSRIVVFAHAALAFWLALRPSTARCQAADAPMKPAAKAHYRTGLDLYGHKDFAAAIHELSAAYALDPRREILFAQAQATRLAGDCPGAAELFEKFLASNPPEQQVEAARIALGRCDQRAPPPAASPPPAAIAVVPPPPTPPPPRPRWYGDRLGLALVAAGTMIGVSGLASMISAANADPDPRAQATLTDYADRRSVAEARWGWGLAGMVTGAALVATGAVRFVLIERSPGATTVAAGGHF